MWHQYVDAWETVCDLGGLGVTARKFTRAEMLKSAPHSRAGNCVDYLQFRIEGVNVTPVSKPSGDRKRLTV